MEKKEKICVTMARVHWGDVRVNFNFILSITWIAHPVFTACLMLSFSKKHKREQEDLFFRAELIPVFSSNSKSMIMPQLHSSCWRRRRLRMDWFVMFIKEYCEKRGQKVSLSLIDEWFSYSSPMCFIVYTNYDRNKELLILCWGTMK